MLYWALALRVHGVAPHTGINSESRGARTHWNNAERTVCIHGAGFRGCVVWLGRQAFAQFLDAASRQSDMRDPGCMGSALCASRPHSTPARTKSADRAARIPRSRRPLCCFPGPLRTLDHSVSCVAAHALVDAPSKASKWRVASRCFSGGIGRFSTHRCRVGLVCRLFAAAEGLMH